MAAGRIIVAGWMPALDSDGAPIPNAQMYFYMNGTTTLATVYADDDLTTPLPNPVAANSSGQFPAIWADDANLFSVTIDAPYGPPGLPFTYDDLGPSTSTNADVTNKLDRDGLNAEPTILEALPYKTPPKIVDGDPVAAPFVQRSAESKFYDRLDAMDVLNAEQREAVEALATDDAPDLGGNLTDGIDYFLQRYKGLGLPIELRRGVWRFDTQAIITPSAESDVAPSNGIIIQGQGNKATRILCPPGSDGAFKIIQALPQVPKQVVELRHMQFISTVDVRDAGGYDSGYGIHIVGGSVTDQPFGLGLNSDVSVRISDVHFVPDYGSAGEDHQYKGRWKAPIRIEGMYFPEVRNSWFRGPMADPPSPTSAHGPCIDMLDCYAPRVADSWANGPFHSLLRNKSVGFNPNVPAGADRGWEGGWVTNCNTAGTFRSVELTHNFTDEPYMGEPVFKITGNDFSARDHNVVVEGQDLVHVTDNSFLVFENNADPAGTVRACVHLDGVSQGLVRGNISHGPGSYDDDEHCTAFCQVVGPSCHVRIEGNSIANGGLGVVVNTTAGFNPEAGGRNIYVSGNTYGGKTLGWPTFTRLVDPGHKVILSELPVPALGYDVWKDTSASNDTNPSPRRGLLRRRSDFASNASGILGEFTQGGLNSEGVEKEVAIWGADWETNASGSESSIARLWALAGGALRNFLTFSGVLDTLAALAKIVTITTTRTNGNALPSLRIVRRRTDYATSGTTVVPQGEVRFVALGSDNAEYSAAVDVVRTHNNEAGAQDTVREFYVMQDGALALRMTLEPDGVRLENPKFGLYTPGTDQPATGVVQLVTADGTLVNLLCRVP